MKRRYIVILFLLSVLSSCTDKFQEFNTDKKNPAEVPGEALFSNAQKDLSDQVNQANINWNIWRLMAQYWTETTYTDEVNYDLVTRNIPEQIFRANYRRVLTDLKNAKELISAAEVPASEQAAKKQQTADHRIDECLYFPAIG
jgi:lysine/ornithine N-monooxygenase